MAASGLAGEIGVSNRMETLGEFEDRTGRWLAGRRPPRGLVIAAIVCVLVTYLGSVTNRWLPSSEGALTLGLARSLAHGQGYAVNGEPTVTTAPVLPILLVPLEMAFGEGNYWAANLLVALCGLAALWTLSGVLSRWTDRWTVLVVMLGTAFSYGFFVTSHRILNDMPAVLVFWLAVAAALRGRSGSLSWTFAAGLLAVAAVSVRWSAATTLVALGAALVIDGQATILVGNRRVTGWPARIVSGGTVLLAVALAAWAVTAVAQGRGLPAPTGITLQGSSVARLSAGLARLPAVYGDLLINESRAWSLGGLGLLLATIGAMRFWWSGRRMVPALTALYVVLLAATRGQAYEMSHLAPVLPLLLLLTVDGLCWSVDLTARERQGRPASPTGLLRAVVIFAAVVVLPNGVRVVRDTFYYMPLSYTSRYYDTVRDGRLAIWFDLGQALHAGSADRPAVADPDAINILHWLSGRRMVAWPSNPRQTAEDAGEMLVFFAAQPELAFAVIDRSRGTSDYVDTLVHGLVVMPGLTVVYECHERYRNYIVLARSEAVIRQAGR